MRRFSLRFRHSWLRVEPKFTFFASLNCLFRLTGILIVVGAFTVNVRAVNVPRERTLLDSG
jgi:hypothetical protein